MAIKVYTRRDSATSFLRKQGISASQYGDLISKLTNGTFEVDTDEVDAILNPPTVAKVVQHPGVGSDEKLQAAENGVAKKIVTGTHSVAAFMRMCILDGLPNEETFAAAQAYFGTGRITAKHRSHPSWYRSEIKRNVKAREAASKALESDPALVRRVLED